MPHRPFIERYRDFDGLEYWLEKYERIWVPLAALVLLTLVAFVVLSSFHFFSGNPVSVRSSHMRPPVPAEW
jgi:hypothetical protein